MRQKELTKSQQSLCLKVMKKVWVKFDSHPPAILCYGLFVLSFLRLQIDCPNCPILKRPVMISCVTSVFDLTHKCKQFIYTTCNTINVLCWMFFLQSFILFTPDYLNTASIGNPSKTTVLSGFLDALASLKTVFKIHSVTHVLVRFLLFRCGASL